MPSNQITHPEMGRVVRRVLDTHGVKNPELARILDVHHSTASHWRNGRAAMTFPRHLMFCWLFQLHRTELVPEPVFLGGAQYKAPLLAFLDLRQRFLRIKPRTSWHRTRKNMELNGTREVSFEDENSWFATNFVDVDYLRNLAKDNGYTPIGGTAQNPVLKEDDVAKKGTYEGPSMSCDARPGPTQVVPDPKPEPVRIVDPYTNLKGFLSIAEKLRKDMNIEWIVNSGTGKLSARALIVMEGET